MTVRRDGDTIWLEGVCRVEEAEIVAGHLAAGVGLVDVSRCLGVHAAVAQALLAGRARIIGAPDDPFLKDHLFPALTRDVPVATSGDRDARNNFPSGFGSEGTEGASN